MEIRNNEKFYIITPLSPILNRHETQRIFEEINNAENVSEFFALDLSCVKDCTYDFLLTLKEFSSKHKLGLFNISSDIFAIFNFYSIDKIHNLFVSELDFEENKHILINRKFSIV